MKEFNGFGLSLSLTGATYYCFNARKTNLQTLVKIETLAQINAINNKYRLFKMYDTDSMGIISISFN
jgi:hypothetical protein